jgi:hypothetical protein
MLKEAVRRLEEDGRWLGLAWAALRDAHNPSRSALLQDEVE